MANEFDSILPNTQVPRAGVIGRPDNKWSEIHGISGCYDCVIVSGEELLPYGTTIAEITVLPEDAVLSAIFTHNLGTEFIDIQIYDEFKEVIQPDSIVVLDENRVQLTFVEPQGCTVLVQKGKT